MVVVRLFRPTSKHRAQALDKAALADHSDVSAEQDRARSSPGSKQQPRTQFVWPRVSWK